MLGKVSAWPQRICHDSHQAIWEVLDKVARTVMDQARQTAASQAAQRAAKQQSSKSLKASIIEGDRLASLLRAAVKQHYGPASEKVAEFGVQPFRGRKRTPKATPDPTPAPAPGPASAPAPHAAAAPTTDEK